MTVYNTLLDPWDIKTDRSPGRLFYVCPHCQHEVEQTIDNFHYWCSECGCNAKNPTGSISRDIPSGEWASQSVRISDVWHRLLIRTADIHEMRCGLRARDPEMEHAVYPTSFGPADRYCPTCFVVMNE